MRSHVQGSQEMRHAVTTPGYVLRKRVDQVLATVTGGYVPFGKLLERLGGAGNGFPREEGMEWVGLYTMVTFRPDISYGRAKRKAERQSTIITGIGWAVGIGICLTGLAALLGT